MELGTTQKGQQQGVAINGFKSCLVKVSSGVPHESILSPLLFVIHINGIPSIFTFLQPFLFADDSKFLGHITSPLYQKLVEKDLDQLASWSFTSRFDFNLKKPSSLLSSKTNMHQISQTTSSMVSQYQLGRLVETLVLRFLLTSSGPCITKKSPAKCTKYLASYIHPLTLGSSTPH